MKFKTFLEASTKTKEQVEFSKWEADQREPEDQPVAYYSKDGELECLIAHTKTVDFMGRESVKDRWNPPAFIKPTDWGEFYSVALWDYTIDDIGRAPNVTNSLGFHGCIIKSFRNVEKLGKIRRMYFTGSTTVEGGWLRLLKMYNLNEIHTAEHVLDDKAVDIINKHLSSGKNIVECQADLIDAGFEEIAKL